MPAASPRRGPTPRPTTRSRRRAARPRSPRRPPSPSRRWPGAARWRPSSGARAQLRRDLLELARVIEIVDADEQERLAPVEQAEEAVGDRLLEPGCRVRAQRAREQRLAIPVEDREPLRGRVARRRRPLVSVAPLARRLAVERLYDSLAEV